ncbi:MAG: Fic family protein [Dehalococcoidia bacterium]|nr:Fic family protein [Dehalococcoidia bacterium]
MAFVPDPLPRQMDLDASLVFLLDRASRSVARLAGIGETLRNPHLLIRPFVRREAVLSSRIEGTQASISDLFLFEAAGERRARGDVREVANYVRALEYGLAQLNLLPISIRLVNQIHAELLADVRGKDQRPGELRGCQVWIGSEGTSIEEARYIAPPPDLVPETLADWERFVNEDVLIPPLVQCAMMHYQFEAIHPYRDGNGRIGRLLITLFLCAKGVLPTPLLYLSAFFDRHRNEYYDHLYDVSARGAWHSWLRFFLRGVAEQAQDALVRSRRIRVLQEEYRATLHAAGVSGNAVRLLDELFAYPFMTVPFARRLLGSSAQGARNALEKLRKTSIVRLDKGKWPRVYVASELLEAIEAPVVAEISVDKS